MCCIYAAKIVSSAIPERDTKPKSVASQAKIRLKKCPPVDTVPE